MGRTVWLVRRADDGDGPHLAQRFGNELIFGVHHRTLSTSSWFSSIVNPSGSRNVLTRTGMGGLPS